MSIKSLALTDMTNGLSLNAAVMNSYSLTLCSGGIAMKTGVTASTIAVPVVLGGNQIWTNQSANPLTVSGAVSGPGNLSKAGTGTLTLPGVNSFDGDVTVTAGTLKISQATLPPHSIVTVENGATLQLDYPGTTPGPLSHFERSQRSRRSLQQFEFIN
jgi:fibronectin-binding autotransporter adhesin